MASRRYAPRRSHWPWHRATAHPDERTSTALESLGRAPTTVHPGHRPCSLCTDGPTDRSNPAVRSRGVERDPLAAAPPLLCPPHREPGPVRPALQVQHHRHAVPRLHAALSQPAPRQPSRTHPARRSPTSRAYPCRFPPAVPILGQIPPTKQPHRPQSLSHEGHNDQKNKTLRALCSLWLILRVL